jgi:hypothetical protein
LNRKKEKTKRTTKMFRVSRLLRQAVSTQAMRKAPLANGPLQCPQHMDGLYHKSVVIFLQQFGGLFVFLTSMITVFRYQHWVRKADYLKYLDQAEVRTSMINYGALPRDPTEWQKANIAKARAALEGGDDEDDE